MPAKRVVPQALVQDGCKGPFRSGGQDWVHATSGRNVEFHWSVHGSGHDGRDKNRDNRPVGVPSCQADRGWCARSGSDRGWVQEDVEASWAELSRRTGLTATTVAREVRRNGVGTATARRVPRLGHSARHADPGRRCLAGRAGYATGYVVNSSRDDRPPR